MNILSFPDEYLKPAMDLIRTTFPERFGGGQKVRFRQDPELAAGANRISIESTITITYGNTTGALRALGRVMGAFESTGTLVCEETSPFKKAGIMLDLSRNAVMRTEELKRHLVHYALMGINAVMLYMEDTYEVPGEPFFGYMRGGYKQAELRDLDSHANSLGIELIPCIQALGHMEQFLQWPSSKKYQDTKEILCAGEDEVYALIERMIDAVSSCFRTQRIHIGMDEAHGLGTGRFRKKNGDVPPYSIINKHLNRVRLICSARGLNPMIWSDMYFRLGSKTDDYYDENWEISDEDIAGIPEDVSLVYWDYYHTSVDHYSRFINFHKKLGSTPIVAGGIWTWQRFWAGTHFTIKATDACMTACRNEGIEEVYMTLWGDDGGECDYQSAFPGLQHFAELLYAHEVDESLKKQNLIGSCDVDYDAYMLACQIDTNPHFDDDWGAPSYAAKNLLWQDPILPIFEAHTIEEDYSRFYFNLSDQLLEASEQRTTSDVLRIPALIARAIGSKVEIYRALRKAHETNDKSVLPEITCQLGKLTQTFTALWHEHRASWMRRNRAMGWEVVEARYGGMIARLQTLAYRIGEWTNGTIDRIEELDVELQDPWPGKDWKAILRHSRSKTASCIK